MKSLHKNYYEMTIIDHHREYPLPKQPNVHIQTCWDGFRASSMIDIFIELFYPNHPVPESSCRTTAHINDDELVAVMKRAWFTHPNVLTDPYEPIDWPCDVHATFYRITGHIDDLEKWAELYATTIINESMSVGGDDDYFDYFPTFHFMFYCVCRELDLPDLYNETYDSIVANLRNDDDSIFDDDPNISNMWTE